MGRLILKGRHRLLIGDATNQEDVARLMQGGVATCVFTSPPYSDLRDYAGGLNLDPKHLARFLDFPARTFYVNLGLIIRDRSIVPYWNAYLEAAKERGLKLLSWNVWDKGNASAPAHQQAMFGLCHEWVFVFGEYRPLNLTNPNRLAGEFSRGPGTQRERDGTLSVKSKHVEVREFRQLDSVFGNRAVNNSSSEYSGHPASFPIALPEAYLLAATAEGDIVGDPFGGSGSTLLAAHRNGRRCFLMEIDPCYATMILDRFHRACGIEPVRQDGARWSEVGAPPSNVSASPSPQSTQSLHN